MTLQERINADLKEAMLSKNEAVRDLLRVVVGEFSREIEREGKILKDSTVESILKTMIKNANIMGAKSEIEILEKYMPQLMSEAEIVGIVNALVKDGVNTIKEIMKEFNTKYKGKADNKLVSDIVKDIL